MLKKCLLGAGLMLALSLGTADARPPGPPFSCHMQSLDEIIDALLTGGEIEGIVCYY